MRVFQSWNQVLKPSQRRSKKNCQVLIHSGMNFGMSLSGAKGSNHGVLRCKFRELPDRALSTVTGCTRQLSGCSMLLFCTRDLGVINVLSRRLQKHPWGSRAACIVTHFMRSGLCRNQQKCGLGHTEPKQVKRTRPSSRWRDVEALRRSALALLVRKTP